MGILRCSRFGTQNWYGGKRQRRLNKTENPFKNRRQAPWKSRPCGRTHPKQKEITHAIPDCVNHEPHKHHTPVASDSRKCQTCHVQRGDSTVNRWRRFFHAGTREIALLDVPIFQTFQGYIIREGFRFSYYSFGETKKLNLWKWCGVTPTANRHGMSPSVLELRTPWTPCSETTGPASTQKKNQYGMFSTSSAVNPCEIAVFGEPRIGRFSAKRWIRLRIVRCRRSPSNFAQPPIDGKEVWKFNGIKNNLTRSIRLQ